MWDDDDGSRRTKEGDFKDHTVNGVDNYLGNLGTHLPITNFGDVFLGLGSKKKCIFLVTLNFSCTVN